MTNLQKHCGFSRRCLAQVHDDFNGDERAVFCPVFLLEAGGLAGRQRVGDELPFHFVPAFRRELLIGQVVQLLLGVAGQALERPVRPENAPAEVGHGERLRRLLDDIVQKAQFGLGPLALGNVPDDAGEVAISPRRNSLTARSIGNVEPSLRRPMTSRPMPMIFASPVRR